MDKLMGLHGVQNDLGRRLCGEISRISTGGVRRAKATQKPLYAKAGVWSRVFL